jgi:hypothetical protein
MGAIYAQLFCPSMLKNVERHARTWSIPSLFSEIVLVDTIRGVSSNYDYVSGMKGIERD